jgi:Ca2+-binding RTX toxin-like protein
MLNASFREIGAGIAQGVFQFTQGPFNSVDATENFAFSGSKVFITGVCINDADGDNFYDIGEGRSGISVQVRQGGTLAGSATSAPAGGYAVGVAAGSYEVMFSGGGLAGAVTCVIDASSGNVKVDLAGADEILSSGNVTLGGGARHATLLGVAALSATGNSLANALTGNKGSNTLNGGTGADTLAGGPGNDTYVIDSPGDVVAELGNEGVDTVRSGIGFALGANLENLVLTGSGAINGSGNTLNNVIVGNGGNNVLDGAAGTDTASYSPATAGVSVNLTFTSAQNTGAMGLDTLAGIENLVGSSHADTLTGNSLANTLNGGAGADSLAGGAGNDIYVVDHGGDTVAEAPNAGIDTVQASVSVTLADNVENLQLLGSSAINATGNGLANTLTGNAAGNVLNGGAGVDAASYANAAAAVAVSLALGAAQNTLGAGIDTLLDIENLVGSPFSDRLTGNGQNNVLVGGLGNDVLDGGAGVDSASYANASAGVNVTLASAGVQQNTVGAGLDTLIAIESLIGSNLNDTLAGDGAANTLIGGLGNDSLNGGAGNDVLSGSGGADTLTGGAGSDAFHFSALAGSDSVTDFVSGSDKFRFSQAAIRVGDGDTLVEGAAVVTGPGGFAPSAELVIVTASIAGAVNVSSAATAIGAANATYGPGATALFTVNNGSGSGLFLFASAGADALVSAAELTQIAAIAGTPATSAGDYVFVA